MSHSARVPGRNSGSDGDFDDSITEDECLDIDSRLDSAAAAHPCCRPTRAVDTRGVIVASVWMRLNTGLLLLLLLGMIATYAMRAEGGPLDPPGAPSSTDSVRLPGTPIAGPTTISQPGHYYLTRSFQAVGTNGITITASDVSLDLGGFTISGSGSGITGIAISGGARVVIENGTVRDFQIGVSAFGLSATIRQVRALGNDRGFDMALSGAHVEDCEASSNGETGILLRGPGSVISRCTAMYNGGPGVTLGLSGAGDGNVLESSVVSNNNAFNGSEGAGVVIASSGNTLKSNIVGGMGRDIHVITGTANRLQDNFCVGTGTVTGAFAGFGNHNCGN